MRRTHVLTPVLAVMSATLLGCAQRSEEASCRAVAIPVSSPPYAPGDNARLTDAMDGFAKPEGLVGLGAFPGARSYKQHDGHIRIVIAYGVGPLGALITTYDWPGSTSDGLAARLDHYIARRVAVIWRVRPCQKIPSYGGGSITE